jgi:hypothetical protein
MPLVYQYAVGGIVFFGTIILAAKVRAISLSNKSDRSTVVLLISGFILFFLFHLIMILVSGA